MESPKWRIYYADKTTFSNLEDEPWQAPATGVIAIIQDNSLELVIDLHWVTGNG